jgi:hypothetical protein
MRVCDLPSEEDLFAAYFRQQWEMRFDQRAPLWAVELARALAAGDVVIVGKPAWPALSNIARMVGRCQGQRQNGG